jgi:hypothetical protein
MAFAGDKMCTSFKQEILVAEHNFTLAGDLFHMALYDNSAVLTAATTAYTSSGELTGGVGNYVTRGSALTNVTPTTNGTTAYTDFEDEVWGTATFTAFGSLIFNEDHAGDGAVVVNDFTEAKTATAGDFTVQFPAFDASNAIIRIA